MSYINQRYSKGGTAQNKKSEILHTEQLYIDGKRKKNF
jgi:hypothetical protein